MLRHVRIIALRPNPGKEICSGRCSVFQQATKSYLTTSPDLASGFEEHSQSTFYNESVEEKNQHARKFEPSSSEALSRAIFSQAFDLKPLRKDIGNLKPRPIKTDPLVRRKSWISFIRSRREYSPSDISQFIGTNILTAEDGRGFASVFAGVESILLDCKSTDAISSRSLQLLNAIVSRLNRLNVLISPRMAICGVQLAAKCAATSALRFYLEKLASLDSCYFTQSQLVTTFEALYKRVEKEYFEGWTGIRHRQALLSILTGFADNILSSFASGGRTDFFPVRNNKTLAAWLKYIQLVRKLGGKEAVYAEWLRITSLSNSDLDGEAWTRTRDAQTAEKVQLHPQVHDTFARIFAQEDDPKAAWQIVRSSPYPLESINDDTWSLLLDHPDFLTFWKPSMADVVLKKYDEDLSKIEKAYGVMWLGKDDGIHVPGPKSTLNGKTGSSCEKDDRVST